MKRPGWRSSGGCPRGVSLADGPRDAAGRVLLTQRQRQVLDAIGSHIATHGWPPTLRELADRFGWSGPSAAKQQITWLERKGWLVVGRSMSRAIRIVGE